MKKLLFLVLSMFSILAQSQQSFIEKYNLPVYDCDRINYNDFWKSDVVIVTPDNVSEVWIDAKNMQENNKEKKIQITIKKESELETGDLNCNLFILGTLQDYSQWDKLNIPVSKLAKGFQIENYTFTDPLHRFTYVSDHESGPMRIAYIGNNLESYKELFNMPPLGFNLVVKKGMIPLYIGYNHTLFDLSAFKDNQYVPKESNYFIFFLSKDLSEEQREAFGEEVEKYDSFVGDFIKKLQLDMPKGKIKTYIHAGQQEIKFISGNYGDGCEDGIMNGYALDDEIYSWIFSDNALMHEAGHNLINTQINTRTFNFISEGIQMWYLFTTNDTFKQIGITMAKEFASEDLTDVIIGKENFFQGDKYYLISGIFVDYIIDMYGIDKFKELYAYRYDEIYVGFEKTYHKPLSILLKEYKDWLLK